MFKQRKPKRFNYQPRHSNSEEEQQREDFKTKWNDTRDANKRKGSFLTSLPVLLILLVAIILLFYILDSY